jgi:hypothetical protein
MISIDPDEFWYEISYIRKIISLPFYAYVEYKKWSTDAILTSILVWMWPCHGNHGYDDIIMPVATVSILFWWFLLILNEFWHEISCIKKIIFLPFYAYVEHKKQRTDAILHPF